MSLSLSQRASVWLQYLLPQQGLTQLAGALARRRLGCLTQLAIRRFVARYQVDLQEAVQPDPAAYATFNEFFARALRPQARPLAAADLVCPVDGAVSQCGVMAQGLLVQAKGHRYALTALLAGESALSAALDGGCFATLYLSPRDYHRVHMPCAGRLLRMVYVPGALFSVNPVTAQAVPGLFARNERVVCVFEGERAGQRFPFVLVLVGATIVGSMATVWHGVVNPPRPGVVRQWDYSGRAITLAQGAEMGRFLLGSTVIVLLPPGVASLSPQWVPGRPVRMGEAMGQWC
jgi:phosphatidylserine decarboxylase